MRVGLEGVVEVVGLGVGVREVVVEEEREGEVVGEEEELQRRPRPRAEGWEGCSRELEEEGEVGLRDLGVELQLRAVLGGWSTMEEV